MRSCEEECPVELMAKACGISRSGYYAWKEREESKRSVENRKLLGEIRRIHHEVDATYGSPRMHQELVESGFPCGVHRVARIMAGNDIAAVHKPTFRVTTDSAHSFPTARNLLGRDFEAAHLNEKWAGDITFIPTQEGWLYLAVVMDLGSRKIIGWRTQERLDRSLVLRALRMALEIRGKAPDLYHSDQGSQYACDEFQRLLFENEISCSMSRTGNCWDNAVVESFFHSLKVERVHRRNYKTRVDAQKDIFQYIELFYNRRRRHSALGLKSPVAFEETTMAA